MKRMALVWFALWHKLTDAGKKGYMKLLAHTVDTDVDAVAIATLNNIKPDGLLVAFDSVHFRLQPMK